MANAKCIICNTVFKGTFGIGVHTKRIHGVRAELGSTWEMTKFAPTKAATKKPDKPKRKYVRRKLITPETQYILLPVTLKIPVSFGALQIEESK